MSTSVIEEINENEIDDLLAKEERLRYGNGVELPFHQQRDVNQEDDILCSQVGGKAGTILYQGIEAHGFHLSAGSTYIYPTNYPVRQYQASIVKTALFKNTLVSLPTGLGKTFIAAVVMYNFYRWYPHGKVVFMAPTRPLVAQQTKACHHIMNIPQEDTIEMTGMLSAEQRTALWRSKRVFYLTPQVMVNDLKVKSCPASLIKCVVIDEAHRATKDYAYCQVLKILSETDAVFRILGLSATPGNDISAVQQVVQNLRIAALEMRSEESLDVVPYTHSRDINTIVVELSGNLLRVKEDLLQVFEKYAKKLKDFKALSYNISSISKFQVLKACEKFRGNPPRGVPPAMIGSLISDFTVCMSLAHSLELLQIYGLRAFHSYLTDDSGEKSKTAITRLKNDEHIKEMLKRLHLCLFPKSDENMPYTWGHPKLQKLVVALSEHFKKAEENKSTTKAIIFCQYRVVVNEIVQLLKKFKPLINAMEFIGQSGGKEKGMPQAKQLQIMKDFRNGVINCLVATCVAEEGLDIGDVDLIILMEAHKSPVRLVQRLGRTGRKRKGHCIVLLTKGKEEQKFHEAMATRKSYVQNIVNAPGVKSSLWQESPRMIPSQCNPVQQLVHIKASNFESPARVQNKKQADIRKCFAVPAPGPSHLSDKDLLQVLEEIGDSKLVFNKVPKRQEIWPRRHGEKISLDELLSKDLNILSEWNEWNYDEHQTYLIGHTSHTKMLCHLLKASNEEISLPDYYLCSAADIDEEDYKKDVASSKGGKKRKLVKNEVKKNLGMDIRNCLNVPSDKNRAPEIEIIEIVSDNSEDIFPNSVVEPETKKIKISDKELSFTTKATTCFEENNNLCDFLSKYMFPKRNLKETFVFKPVLPDLESVLKCVTSDLLIKINVKEAKDCITACEIVKSPIVSIGESPLSSTAFGVDDLFEEEIICQENVDHERSYISHSKENQNLEATMRLDVAKEMEDSLTKSLEVSKEASDVSFDIDDILNSNIEMNMSDRENKLVTNRNYVPEGKSGPSTNTFKTLTSSFRDIHRNNLKVFESFREKKETTSQNLIQIEANLTVSKTTAKPHENITLKNELNDQSQQKSLDPVMALLDDDHDFECIEENILKSTKEPEFFSTPKKSPTTNQKRSENNCSPLDINNFSVAPNITCSTPLITVKKFKKNVMLLDNKVSSGSLCPLPKERNENAPVVPLTENRKTLSPIIPKIEKRDSPSPNDAWSLSDILEDDEESIQAKAQDSTMLGITQMVSLIEKEKKKNVPPQELVENKSLQTIEAHPFPSKAVGKTDNLSALLHRDVNMFCELNIESSTNVSAFNNKCTIEDKDDIYENDDIMLTQKYNLTENTENHIPLQNDKALENDDSSQEINFSNLNTENSAKITYENNDFLKTKKSSIPDNEYIDEIQFSPVIIKNDLLPDNLAKDIDDKKMMGRVVMDNDCKASLVPDHCESKPSKIQIINSIETWDDDDDFNDVLLTQKYNISHEKRKPISPEKDSEIPMVNSHINKIGISKPTHNNIVISSVKIPNADLKTSDKPGNELDSSESICSSQTSQSVNFKKFSKKSVLPLKLSRFVSGNNIPSTSSQTNKNIENQNSEPPFKKPKATNFGNRFENTEKSFVYTQINMLNVKEKSSSEPLAKMSLFNSKSRGSNHRISDDSDDDVFNLPLSSSNKTAEKNHIETSNDIFLPAQKVNSFKEKRKITEENYNHKVLPPALIRKPNLPTSKTNKRLKNNHGLIVVEADVSGEFSSDDSDGSSLDNLDNSFINDNTECFTQTMYLKSVKSPIGQGKFKIPVRSQYAANVYSQQVAEEESEYMNDSFCVDSEDESVESNEQSLSLLEAVENELDKKKRGKRKRRRILNKSSDDSMSPERKGLCSSACESIPNPHQIKKRKWVLSDSESDSTPLKTKKTSTVEIGSLIAPMKTTNPHVFGLRETRISHNFVDLTSSDNEEDCKIIKNNFKSNTTQSFKGNNYCKENVKSSSCQSKLDKKLHKLNEKFTNDLDKIKQKYFGSDDSSD